jgi:hypothetical protein
MNSYHGPPMTLGNAASAHVRLIGWCLDCRHQVEPDPAEMAERHDAEMPSLIGTRGWSSPSAAAGGSISSSPERSAGRCITRTLPDLFGKLPSASRLARNFSTSVGRPAPISSVTH